jgi:putative phage-type endonuclease
MLDPRRKGAITASEIGAIAGNGRFATRDDVIRRKVREHNGLESEFVSNVATRWGNDNEAQAVAEFEFVTDHLIDSHGEDQQFVDRILERGDGIVVRAGCTPDGVLQDGGLLEVKCPYGIRNDTPDASLYLSKCGEYLDQMQWQMMVTNSPHCAFVVWTTEGIDHLTIKQDFDHQERLIVEALKFQQELNAILADPELQKPYLQDKKSKKDSAIERSDSDYAEAAAFYRNAQAALVEAQAVADEAKQALIDLTEGLDVKGCGVSIIHSTRAGAVDYKLVPELKGVDLTPFRKPETVTVTVKVDV